MFHVSHPARLRMGHVKHLFCGLFRKYVLGLGPNG